MFEGFEDALIETLRCRNAAMYAPRCHHVTLVRKIPPVEQCCSRHAVDGYRPPSAAQSRVPRHRLAGLLLYSGCEDWGQVP
jgi:hypothetical protein